MSLIEQSTIQKNKLSGLQIFANLKVSALEVVNACYLNICAIFSYCKILRVEIFTKAVILDLKLAHNPLYGTPYS